jgi:hypothetical protein
MRYTQVLMSFFAGTADFGIRFQQVLTSKKQHAQKNTMVVLKSSGHFERYLSDILFWMGKIDEKL